MRKLAREKTGKKHIYYAHSMQIFHTRREEEELILIQSYFPDMTIINPSEIDPKDFSGQFAMN
ncbi:MAG: hypothetical protein ACXADY_21980 [Candidatus Hodarchaeales archaeon]